MKIVRLPLLAIMSITSSLRVDTTPYITTIGVYGPFSGDGNETISLVAHGDYSGCRLFVTYTNYRTGAILASERSTIEYYSPDENGVFNYTLRTSGRINGDGLRVAFNLSKEKGSGVIQEVVLYPTNAETVYSYQYRKKPYLCPYKTFQINGKTEIRNYEEYSFENTIDYISNSIDNYLDIREVSFSYDNGNELINKENDAYLRFKDSDNLFPMIAPDEDGYINIPIKCIQNDKDISFDFNATFYYTKINGFISLTSRPRAVTTSYFMLPKTGVKKMEDYDFFIEMNNFGRCKNKVIIPLQFFKDRNYTGLCTDSNYCIVGGIREW